jgi:hypothetical protein
MSRPKKTARDMTNDELAKRIFPKKVRDKLKEIAHEKDKKSDKSGSNPAS